MSSGVFFHPRIMSAFHSFFMLAAIELNEFIYSLEIGDILIYYFIFSSNSATICLRKHFLSSNILFLNGMVYIGQAE